MDKFFRYITRYINVTPDTPNGYVTLDRYCNSYTVKNVDGSKTDTVTIDNNVVLQPGDDANFIPGESYTLPGNYGEIFTGRLQLTFSGAAGKALVIEKYYVNYQEVINMQNAR